MDEKDLSIKIWGCRGSHPTSGLEYLKYGGNTSCVEISFLHDEVKRRLIFDGGTGLGFLGLSLKDAPPDSYNIFLSHLHMEHIFSLPHFFPNYRKDNFINILMFSQYWDAFEEIRKTKIAPETVFSFPTYPIHPSDFEAKIILSKFYSYEYCLAKIDACLVNHYEGSTVYRIVRNGKKIIYAPDIANESLQSARLKEFCLKANLLICDSTYTRDQINEMTAKKHSCIESVIDFAKTVGAKKVLHFHHSPLREDMELFYLEEGAKKYADGNLLVKFARDGMEIRI